MEKRQQERTNSQEQRIKLPFEKRNMDFATWCYYHRHGLLSTVIIVLCSAIIFVSTRITVFTESHIDAILVDMEQEEPPKPEPPQIKQQLTAEDFKNVQNAESNENAEEMSEQERQKLIDQLDADKLIENANKAMQGIENNRNKFQQGVDEAQDILNSKNKEIKGSNKEPKNAKIKGNVSVSFSFVNPIRSSYKLVIPSYMCEGGGQIVVNAALDRNGNVVSAVVDKSRSTTTDLCMVETAIKAAKASRFNVDGSAPERHSGTISYIFVPQ